MTEKFTLNMIDKAFETAEKDNLVHCRVENIKMGRMELRNLRGLLSKFYNQELKHRHIEKVDTAYYELLGMLEYVQSHTRYP